MNEEKYQYGPLAAGEIRLLYIDSVGSDPIGRMVTHNVKSEIDYVALSWTWPEIVMPAQHYLTIGGQVIGLSQNLSSFFESLKDGAATKTPIWIDAICINQDDSAEKSEQIPLMESIYSQAMMTLVWLGSSKIKEFGGVAVDNKALRALPKINRDLSQFSFDPKTSHLSLNRAMPNSLIQHQMGWCTLVLTTWFTRVWTMQEYVLARAVTFMYGETHATAEDLQTFIHYYNGLNYRANEALMKPEMYRLTFGPGPDVKGTGLIDPFEANAFETFPKL